jgi:hypothetical protein
MGKMLDSQSFSIREAAGKPESLLWKTSRVQMIILEKKSRILKGKIIK